MAKKNLAKGPPGPVPSPPCVGSSIQNSREIGIEFESGPPSPLPDLWGHVVQSAQSMSRDGCGKKLHKKIELDQIIMISPIIDCLIEC